MNMTGGIKIILSTGTTKIIDKIFGVYRNYIIAHNLPPLLSDSFYIFTSFLEAFANSSMKNEEIKIGKDSAKDGSFFQSIFFLIILTLSCVFLVIKIDESFHYVFIFVMICISYVFYRSKITTMKFNYSSKSAIYIDTIFAMSLTMFLTLVLYLDKNEWVYGVYLIPSVFCCIITWFVLRKNNIDSNSNFDREYYIILVLGLAPLMEKMLIESLGTGVLTSFIISYMIVSVPLIVFPVSTVMVVLHKVNLGKKIFIVPIQFSFVVLFGGLFYYLNSELEIFPYISLSYFFASVIYAFINILISYFETSIMINNNISHLLLIRKYAVLLFMLFFIKFFEYMNILEFMSLFLFVNIVSMMAAFFYLGWSINEK